MLLAEALSQGETHLLLEPPQALIDMEDPYDHTERMNVCNGDNEALWDTAYYNRHYYVYFGVGPVIVYYLPNIFSSTSLTRMYWWTNSSCLSRIKSISPFFAASSSSLASSLNSVAPIALELLFIEWTFIS